MKCSIGMSDGRFDGMFDLPDESFEVEERGVHVAHHMRRVEAGRRTLGALLDAVADVVHILLCMEMCTDAGMRMGIGVGIEPSKKK